MKPPLRAATLVLPMLLLAAACSNDDSDGTPPPTTATATTMTMAPATTVVLSDIVGTALTSHVFTALAGMLVDAGLVETLRSAGPFTVFAPTDEAFAKVPTETLRAVQGDPELLRTVLTYHVVQGELHLSDLQPGELQTVAGIPLQITRDGDQVFVNGSPIAAGDVEANNGVIHVMGDVLVPPS